MKLFFSCNELGLGHVSRTILLGKKLLDRGHEVFFFSGGLAYKLLRKEFDHVYPCTPIKWYENIHGMFVSASVLNILFPLPIFDYEHRKMRLKRSSSEETIRRYYNLRKYVMKIKPDKIISDGDLLALRLAKRWKIESIYITNVIRPSYHFPFFLIPGQRFTERYIKTCRKVIIPDVPKYTICEYNLGPLDKIGIDDKVEFVGSFFDVNPESNIEKSNGIIFAPISGPLGTRVKMVNEIMPVLSRLRYPTIVSLGEPGSHFKRRVGNCEVYGWLSKSLRQEYMEMADVVIFTGSHGTCFEIIKYEKPSICMPTQPEQMGNAKKLNDLKCSIYLKNGTQLLAAISKILRNKEFYEKKISILARYCRKFNGLENAVKTIES